MVNGLGRSCFDIHFSTREYLGFMGNVYVDDGIFALLLHVWIYSVYSVFHDWLFTDNINDRCHFI
jgi:hypothetical protein